MAGDKKKSETGKDDLPIEPTRRRVLANILIAGASMTVAKGASAATDPASVVAAAVDYFNQGDWQNFNTLLDQDHLIVVKMSAPGTNFMDGAAVSQLDTVIIGLPIIGGAKFHPSNDQTVSGKVVKGTAYWHDYDFSPDDCLDYEFHVENGKFTYMKATSSKKYTPSGGVCVPIKLPTKKG